jgi:hypothetical protein
MKTASLLLSVACLAIVVRQTKGAPLEAAHLSEVFQDVRLLTSSAARPAVVNDKINEGMAVKTGGQSRAELTFADLTITRLGENTIFSLRQATREVHVEHGSVLVEVPPQAAAAKITSAAVTAAVQGGTALFGTGPPTKFMVLEGIGTFYPAGHPEEAVTLHGGEMVTLGADGHLEKGTFNVKTVVETSQLIVGFPDLANLPLILQVMDQQQTTQPPSGSSPPQNNLINVLSLNTVANPNVSGSAPGPTGPPSEFGPPTTIASPDPYVITSGTQINTGPTITTNGITDFGKLYRGPALDGSEFDYLFGSTNSFDTTIMDFFNTNGNGVPVAVFKFSSLELTGNPSITIPSGATTFLGFVSVGDVTSGAPGGTLTFAGLDRLFIATVDGSITLGPEIAFSGISHLTFYARGTGSNLTLASPISGADVVHLDSQGTVQINGDITASTEFRSFSGGDFLAGSGKITAQNLDIESLSNLNINASQFPNPPTFGGSVIVNAANTLNFNIDRTGGFGWDTLTAQATTINISGSHNFDFSNSSSVTIAAGTGGIQAPNIAFVGSPPGGFNLTSGGSINIGSTNSEDAIISAATSFTASGDITGAVIGSTLTTGTTVDVGGDLFVFTLTAGGNINVGNGFIALNVNAPSSILTVQGNIGPFGGPGSPQYTYNVDSIIAPAGINFSFNGTPNFVGKLTINANTLTFDPATGIALANFNGVNANEFGSGNPAEGGNGGTFIVNANGNITANSGANITATTGLNSAAGVYSGAGGSVTLLSTGGMVTVNDTIQVSSDDSAAPRQSASGGTIDLQSNLTTGTGITVGANGQLLSLLNANAPGPGGSITLSTKGANIVVNGTITADRGTITMDQNDPAGSTPTITIDGATLTSETLNITGAGDVNIGLSNPVTFNVSNISLSAANNINLGELTVSASAGINFQVTGALNSTGDATFVLSNSGGTFGSDARLMLSAASVSTAGSFDAEIDNFNGGMIGGRANVSLNTTGNVSVSGANGITLQILNAGGSIAGGIPGDGVSYTVGGTTSTPSLGLYVDNTSGGVINTGGNLTLNTSGPVMLNGPLGMEVDNFNGGSITNGANVTAHFVGDVTDTVGQFHSLNFFVLNGAGFFSSNVTGGTIGTGGNINLTFDGNAETTPTSTTGSFAAIIANGGGVIGTGGNISLTVGGNVVTGGQGFNVDIENQGGQITNGGNVTVDVAGGITSATGAFFGILNQGNSPSSAGGFIGSDASVTISAANVSTAGTFDAEIDNFNGGTIGGSASVTVNVAGAINTQGEASFNIFNGFEDSGTAGSIGSDSMITVSAVNISSGGGFNVGVGNSNSGSIGGGATINLGLTGALTSQSDAIFSIDNSGSGTIAVDAAINLSAANISSGGGFFDGIENFDSGSVGSGATINFGLTGALTSQSYATFSIQNQNGGTIASDAAINLSAANISSGGVFFAGIENNNSGSITGSATINFGITGDLSGSAATFSIDNSSSGNIGSDATININANNISVAAGTLFAAINNTGGSIGGDSTINVNVSGTATANDATIQILGNDPSGSAAINFNGGTYEVAGTFFNTIDGNGTITFNNTDIHANVVQAGVFGANGSLIIGGSGSNTISADTLLKLYAPGSNGLLKFVANVTLSSGTAMDLAATTLTINPGVIVTIAGAGGAANVYTNNANYSGFGGSNGSNGTFAGNGANSPQPLANAPTFGTAPSSFSSSSTTGVSNQTLSSRSVSSSANAAGSAISVSNSGQLLSLLNASTPRRSGKIIVSSTATRSRTSTAAKPTARLAPHGGGKNAPSSAGAQQFSATVTALARTQ